MTKKQKPTINVNGLSIKDILNMDLYSLNQTDTKNLANRLVSASNKRLRYLERDKSGHGVASPAYKKVMDKGVFSVKGKKRSQVMNEIKRMREFLSAKSSTTRGWNAIRRKVERRIGEKVGEKVRLSNEEYSNMWSAYELMQDYRDVETLKKIFGDSARAQAFAYEVEQRMSYKTKDEKREFIRDVINRMETQKTTDWKSVIAEIEKGDAYVEDSDSDDDEDAEEDFPW